MISARPAVQRVAKFLRSWAAALLLGAAAVAGGGQAACAETPAQHDSRMQWWREARFGMFIHWGVYAVAAGEWNGKPVDGIGEWIMYHGQIPVKDYETLPPQFNPVQFDAARWVQVARDAGMKYIVITSKHHDGFCMFDSKLTDYDIVDAAPFHRDPLKELAAECRKQGIKLCFYYSIMDWHHPDAHGESFPKYIEHMKGQLRELLTNYGEIGVLWFDGEWIDEWTPERGRDLYEYCRSIQPGIIINNRVGKGRDGTHGLSRSEGDVGDFGTPEQEVPEAGLPGVDWETCMTMNDTWGFKKNDLNWKSSDELIHRLVEINGKGGNFLLNVGPDATGRIPDASIERLAAIGAWMRQNGPPKSPSAPIAATKPAVAASSALTPAEKAAGWKVLFDGASAGGWRGYRGDSFPTSRWVINNGELRSLGSESDAPGIDIITRDQYGDFELTLEFKTAPKANSGIVYRLTEIHDATWQTGPEFQVLDDAGNGIGPDDPHSAGALYDLATPDKAKLLKPAGEWNAARIRLRNNHLEHWLNGIKVVELDINGDDWAKRIAASKFKAYEGFGVQPKGHIALQDHGDIVAYRDIRVRDLDAPMPGEVSLFDGKTFTGWTYHLEPAGKMADTWRIADGIIICTGQPNGYIRTEKDFTSYVLKLQWRFNPVTKLAGNSGVLLRMTGPDKVWPKSIEAQLQSGSAGDFWNIDEVQMKADPARTSGRNTKKTRVAERPVGEWNEYEIIVNGPDIRLLVNGDEVNRAWDVAVVPGKICLQSEGAEIQFRNIRLAPISAP